MTHRFVKDKIDVFASKPADSQEVPPPLMARLKEANRESKLKEQRELVRYNENLSDPVIARPMRIRPWTEFQLPQNSGTRLSIGESGNDFTGATLSVLSPTSDQAGESHQQLAETLRTRLLPRLIDIFAICGISYYDEGEKTLPWTTLPIELAASGSYMTGWPEICLPTRNDLWLNPASHPKHWNQKQWVAMEAQINKGAVKVLPCPEGRVVLFETVDDTGVVKDSMGGFSKGHLRHFRGLASPKQDEWRNRRSSSIIGRMKARVTRPWRSNQRRDSKGMPPASRITPQKERMDLGEDEYESGSGSGEMNFAESRSSNTSATLSQQTSSLPNISFRPPHSPVRMPSRNDVG